MSSIMNYSSDVQTMFTYIYGILIFFSLLFGVWKVLRPKDSILGELISRTASWWVMISAIFVAFGFGKRVAIIAIALLNFVALREFLSSVRLGINDRRAVFWCYLAIPIQYFAIYIEYYRFFIIWIPVLMFLILAIRRIAVNNSENFISSIGILNFSNILVTFSLGHLAYLIVMDYPDGAVNGGIGLAIYLLFLTQANDVLQYIWGKLFGKRKIIVNISPNKTWEGFVGGLISTIGLAFVFNFLTPFDPLQTAIAGFVIAFTGFFGDLNISAIKRDMGIKDMGSSIPGHGGVMDRLDSLSFSALIFFHLVHVWTNPI